MCTECWLMLWYSTVSANYLPLQFSTDEMLGGGDVIARPFDHN